MADSITPADLPAGFDLYGAYVDGLFKNYAAVEAMYPGKVVGIAVFPTTNDGIVGDCENGDMTPYTAVNWVRMRRNAGVDPTIYCSAAAWASVVAAFNNVGTTQPHYWIAAYPGIGQQLYSGSVAHQWIDRGPYDESIVAAYWPGVDPAPVPTPPPPPPVPYPGDNVQVLNESVAMAGGEGWIPSPVSVAKFVSGWFAVENPEVVGHYDTVPTVIQASATPGPHSPNGAIVVRGMVPDGTYTVVLWFAS